MISVEEALERVLAAFSPGPAEQVGLSEGLGRVLAEDLLARRTQPPADVSAMDGYALRAADVARAPVRLRVVGSIAAGAAHLGPIAPGEAVRIFTGAPLPAGADSVVIQENTEARGDGTVDIREGVAEGRHVRLAGLDFRQGEPGLRAGRLLSARDIGLAAAMDRPWLSVRRRPRIAILATGDEIVMPGDPVGPSQIVSSNAHALAAFVRACGGEPLVLGIAADRPDSLRAHAAGARGCEMIVTSGGASVGEHDLVQSALAPMGLEVDFWKIAMRPGKPLIFGRLGETPLLGFPGNPVSSVVCAVLFLRPAIDRMLGLDRPAWPVETVAAGTDLPANDRRQDYLRAALSTDERGRTRVVPFAKQDSSMMSIAARADCLAIRPPHAPAVSAGDPVPILRLHGGVEGI